MDKKPIEITGIMWHGMENKTGFGEMVIEVEFQGKWVVLTQQSLAPETAFSEIMEPAGIFRLANNKLDTIDPATIRRGK